MTKRSKKLVAGVFTHFSVFDKHKDKESEVKVKNSGTVSRLYTPDSLKKHATDTHSRIQASDDCPDTHMDNDQNPSENQPHRGWEEDLYPDRVDTTTEEIDREVEVELGAEEEESEWEQEAVEVELPVDDFEEVEDEDDDFLALVDVDGVEEDSVEDVLFASIDGNLLAIKGNRVIAELTAEDAKEIGVDDIYEEDTFAEAIEASMKRTGLRAGLTNMGFKLTKVNLRSSRVLNTQVDRLVAKRVKGVQQDGKLYAERFAQCLALASVGSARGFFKGDVNTLSDRLVAALEARGVQGAQKLVASIFAKESIGYANMLMARAQKLMSQSDEVRNGFAEALDMVDEGAGIESVVTYEDDEITDFIDAEDTEMAVPEEITAALASPAYAPKRISAAVEQVRAGTTTRAMDLLTSNEVLSFT